MLFFSLCILVSTTGILTWVLPDSSCFLYPRVPFSVKVICVDLC